MNRPLVWAAAAHALGVWTMFWSHAAGQGAAAGVMLLCAVLLLSRRRSIPAQTALLAGGCYAAGIACAWFAAPSAPPPNSSLVYGTESFDARVTESPIFHPETDYAGIVTESGGIGTLVRWSSPSFTVYPGDVIRVVNGRRMPLGNVNFGTTGYEDYLRRQGVSQSASARAGQVALVERPAFSIARLLAQAREKQAALIRRLMPPSSVPFMLAVWLGDRTQLTEDVRDAFVRAGTAHVLAVSGLHVGLVFLVIDGLLVLLRAGERTRGVAVILAVFAFALIAGGRVSSLRAAAMISLADASRPGAPGRTAGRRSHRAWRPRRSA